MTTKIKCGCCKDYHANVTLVKACYATPKTTAAIADMKEKPAVTVVNIATAPQVQIPAHRKAKMQMIASGQLTVKTPAVATVMETPTEIMAAQKELVMAIESVNLVEPAPVLKGQDLPVDTLFQLGDDIYKVIWNKAQTYKYAMKLVFTKWMKKGKFIYAAGIINELDSTMKIDLAGAKSYASWAFEKHGVGVCCNCGKLLTNKESVAAGIGPVCSGKIKKMW